MQEYDLIIVGAGPAGSAAAMLAARRGMRCALLDKAGFPRDKVCGDALSGKSMRLLDELGFLDPVLQLPGTVIHRVVFSSPDESVLEIDLRRHAELHPPSGGGTHRMEGKVVPRRTLDEFLLRQAQAAGAVIHEGCTVQELVFAGTQARRTCGGSKISGAGSAAPTSGACGPSGAAVAAGACGPSGAAPTSGACGPSGAAGATGGSGAMRSARIAGVRGTRADGSPFEFHSRLVLGCDGVTSLVARQSGLHQRGHRHCRIAARQYMRDVDGLTDQIELHFTHEVVPGYLWIFPAGEGLANIGLGLDCVDRKKRAMNPLQTLQEIIGAPRFRHRFRQARAVGRATGGHLPVGSIRRPCSGQGVLLLGDAAGLVDPFTGEGIGNALISAHLAVDTAAEAIVADDASAEFLRLYDQRLWDQLGSELRTSARLHRLSRCRPLFNWVVRRAAHSRELRDLIGAMMAGTESRTQLLHPWFYVRWLAG